MYTRIACRNASPYYVYDVNNRQKFTIAHVIPSSRTLVHATVQWSQDLSLIVPPLEIPPQHLSESNDTYAYSWNHGFTIEITSLVAGIDMLE